MNVVMLDLTGGASCADGSRLTPEAMAQAAAILEVYLNRDVGVWWGGSHRVRVGTPDNIQPGEIVGASHATMAAVGAIALHDVNGRGVATIDDAITLSDSLFGPSNSWLSSWAHECAEVDGDPGCNRWADAGRGVELALEIGDPVEAQGYLLDLGAGCAGYVSNFVLPDYFAPNHDGPFDFVSTLGPNDLAPSAPFALPLGGNYQIWRSAGVGSEHIVQARYSRPLDAVALTVSVTIPFARTHAARRLERRQLPGSRSYQRGVRA